MVLFLMTLDAHGPPTAVFVLVTMLVFQLAA
jgi:hypothetical protein